MWETSLDDDILEAYIMLSDDEREQVRIKVKKLIDMPSSSVTKVVGFASRLIHKATWGPQDASRPRPQEQPQITAIPEDSVPPSTQDHNANSTDWEKHIGMPAVLKMNDLSIKKLKHTKDKINRFANFASLDQTVQYALSQINEAGLTIVFNGNCRSSGTKKNVLLIGTLVTTTLKKSRTFSFRTMSSLAAQWFLHRVVVHLPVQWGDRCHLRM